MKKNKMCSTLIRELIVLSTHMYIYLSKYTYILLCCIILTLIAFLRKEKKVEKNHLLYPFPGS